MTVEQNWYKAKEVGILELVGKTLKAVQVKGDEAILFTCTDGSQYAMYHEQNCCESVAIEDIDGDIQRLVGQRIAVAECRESGDDPPDATYIGESFTWTFYVLRTNLDSVTIRWFGTSNGYYSEHVSFRRIA